MSMVVRRSVGARRRAGSVARPQAVRFGRRHHVRRARGGGVVVLGAGDHAGDRGRRRLTDGDVDRVQAGGALAAVVGIARKHDLFAGAVGADVVGPGHRQPRALGDGGVVGHRAEDRQGQALRQDRIGLRQADDQAIAGGADAGDVARVPALVSRETDDVGSVAGIGGGRVPARRQGAFDDVAEGLGGDRLAGGRREAKAAPDGDRVARAVLRDARHPARDLGDDPRAPPRRRRRRSCRDWRTWRWRSAGSRRRRARARDQASRDRP